MIQPFLAIALLALVQTPAVGGTDLEPALARARSAFIDDGADPDAHRARVVAAVDALEAVGPTVRNVEATEALRELGRVAYRIGDLDTALRATEIALADVLRRDPVDPLTVHDVRLNIASFKKDLGDVDGALVIQLELLAGLEARGTPDDDDRALSLRTNLGGMYFALRRSSEARTQFERVLDARLRRAAGVEDVEIQYARVNLSLVLPEQGETARADELQSTAVANLERLLDANDPTLDDVRLLVASTAYERGNLGRARTLYESVLESFERRLPEGHPQVQRTRLNFALLLQDLGDLARARALQEGVVRVWGATFSPEHPELLLARSHLAASMAEAGDLIGARAMYEELQATLELTLPETSDDIQTNRQGLAAVLRQLGAIESALELERKVLEVWSSRMPDDSPALLECEARPRHHARTLGRLGRRPRDPSRGPRRLRVRGGPGSNRVCARAPQLRVERLAGR